MPGGLLHRRAAVTWPALASPASAWTLLAFLALACGSRSGLLADSRDAPQLSIESPRAPLLPAPGGREAAGGLLPQSEPEPAPSGCVDITRSYVSVPASIMLLIDQSASMNEPFGASTRWNVLREAIVDRDNGLLTWLDASSRVGLMLYTSINGFQSGLACPLITRVDAELTNADSIRAAYLAAAPLPGGDTPTAEAIDEAVLRLNSAPDGVPKHILLLTDGLPDTCAQPDPQLGLDEAITSAEQAFARGIRVHSVGVSEEIAREGLQAMANAGAGKPAGLRFGVDADAEPPLYASTDARELADQLKGIVGDVRTCKIELGTDVGPGRAFEGTLLLDGKLLEYQASDGWSFVDEDTLEVHGASCERILSEGERLQVTFPCLPEFSPR
jgi:von Willebrand factor type A domain-containing protein